MRPSMSRTLLPFAALALVGACAGGNSGASAAPGSPTLMPGVDSSFPAAGGSTQPIESAAPSVSSSPDAAATPSAATTPPTGAPSSGLDAGALASVVGPSGWELQLQGSCLLTVPPVDAENPPPDVQPGALPSLAGSILSVTLADAGTAPPTASASPSADASPSAEASPSPTTVQPSPAEANSLVMTLPLAAQIGQHPAPSSTPTPEGSPAESPAVDAATTLLPYEISQATAQLQVSLPEQFIFESTIIGGAAAPDGRSGYVALDPGTGELVMVHFVCLELATATAGEDSAASPSPSTPAESAAPESASPAGESAAPSSAPESPAASASPAS